MDGAAALPCWIALCALNAARKFDKKGRWVGMSASLFMCALVSAGKVDQTSQGGKEDLYREGGGTCADIAG